MDLRNKLGAFMLFMGAIFLFIFFASLYTPDAAYNFLAFLIGAVLVFLGWPMRRAKRPPPPAPPPPPPAAAAPKKPGRLANLLKGPPKTAPPPPPPPPPPPKKGLAALFGSKPKKK